MKGKKGVKSKTIKNIPVSWVVGIVIIAIAVSFVISLGMINFLQQNSTDNFSDSGKIVVQVGSDFEIQQGKIVVDVESTTDGKKEVLDNGI
jgi:hypothetical protein